MAQRTLKRKEYFVQEYLEGFEASSFVIPGKLIANVARVFAYVIGDGDSNVERLNFLRNKLRKRYAPPCEDT